jgi:hypothetical protein
MNVTDLINLSPTERAEFLETYSIETRSEVYSKLLSQAELEIKRAELAQAAIKKAMLEDQLSEMKKAFKEKIGPVLDEFKDLLLQIKTKSVTTEGLTYKLPDYDQKIIYVVSKEGAIINSRPMLPEERQFTIYQDLKSNQL